MSSHKHSSEPKFNDDFDFSSYKTKIYFCNICDRKYMSRRSLCKHNTTCMENNKMKSLERENLELKAELKKKDESHNTQLNNVISLARENVQVASTSMNMLKYANTYLADAEPLEQLNKKEILGVMKYNNPKGSEKKNEDYVKIAIHKYNHDIFANFVGDMIVDHYKPNDKKGANLIATDTSRLCFIIMQKVKRKKNVKNKEWINDKSGKKFTSLVLNPLIEVINETLLEFINFKKNKNIADLSVELLNMMSKCAELKRDISVGKFTKPILRHVAPSFHFDQLKIMDDDVPTKKRKTKKD
jgi:hypothetical protein